MKFTIGTASSNMEFEEDYKLIKSALLYADEIELIGMAEYAIYNYLPKCFSNANDIEKILTCFIPFLNAFDNEKIAKLMEIDSQLTNDINSLNEQIASLNSEREQAIKDFDIEYALKVNEKIAELEQEIQDKNDEITEYNNKIAQIEAEYKQSSTESNNEMKNDYLDNLIDYAENKGTILSMRDSAYAQVIDEYLNSLSKEDALSELQNNSYIKELLGTNYAYYLYKTQNRK